MSSEAPVAADSRTALARSTSLPSEAPPREALRSKALPSEALPSRSVDAKVAAPGAPSLADLAVTQSAVVVRVSCARPTAIRLMEMGLLPGTRVTLLRRAPLGDPLELSINGYSLSIRRAEALLVDVQRAPEEHTATDASATSALADDDGVEVK